MKRYLVAFLLLSSIFQKGHSQFSMGLIGGLNVSDVNLENVETTNKLDFFVGLAPQYLFASDFEMLFNLDYSRKGYEGEGSPFLDPTKVRYHYIVLSPEFGYRISKFIGIGLGPYSGVKFRESYKIGERPWMTAKEYGFTTTAKAFDFGLRGSVRVYFSKLIARVSYSYGVINTSNREPVMINQNLLEFRESNKNIEIGIGYLLF